MAGNALVGAALSADNSDLQGGGSYAGLGGNACYFRDSDETLAQVPWGGSQTLSSMWVWLSRNNDSGSWVLRQNRVSPLLGPTVIGSGLDTTHQISVSRNDFMDVLTATGSTEGFLDVSAVSFAANSLGAPVCNSHINGITHGGVGVTRNATKWYDISGESDEFGTDGASLLRFKFCTLSWLSVNCAVNTFPSPQTFNLRKNLATNMTSTAVFVGGQTGFVTDTTHQDSVNNNDVVYIQGQNAAMGGSFTLRQTSAWQTLSQTQTLLATGGSWNPNAGGNSNYANLAPYGGTTGNANGFLQPPTGALAVFAAVYENVRLGSISYTSATGVLTARSCFNDTTGSGGSFGNQVLSIPNTASGDYEDTTHQDSIAALPNGTQITLKMTANDGALTWDSFTSQLNGVTPPVPSGAVTQGGKKSYTRIWGNFH